ncbi:MAG: tetratricopeptide repeat protein [Rhodospirillaceae bacterium]|nr:tetratricopeptide repeat protein [Rhodospirillaceae bacterium]
MPPDPRLGLAQKYALSGLHDDAWETLQGVLADDPSRAALQLAAGLLITKADFAAAADMAARALTHDPQHAETQFNLALALDHLSRPADAIEAYRRAIALNPAHSRAHNNLGVALMAQGQFTAARTVLTEALQHEPANSAALINLGVAETECGDVAAGLARFDDVLRHEPGNIDARDNRLFSAHYVCDDPDALMALHKRLTGEDSVNAASRSAPDPCRRLRVGYVSPDFRRHSVAFFIEPLLAAHDRDAVEVFCYSNSGVTDDVTARLRACADHWRSIVGLSAAAAAELIRHDGIDVLVDLAGHTVGNRLDVFALRCAPVQITALGYPSTTGLAQMDGRLCDNITDPFPSADQWATERLLRLSTGLHCYAPPHAAPDVQALPALKRGYITFGSFNKLAKVSSATVELWSAVLQAVPSARLLIKAKALSDADVQKHLTAQFSAHGVAAERLDLMGWRAADADHLGLYHGVDVALDTYPYNGTTTTCEALWMGVPVVTRQGRTHASRVGASLLTGLQLDEFICADTAQYVACAVNWASRLQELPDLRFGLRARMQAAPLCRAQDYARAVEAAYRSCFTGS